jgi:Fungal Zn(2)-Cys(6) binuclear cluster domain
MGGSERARRRSHVKSKDGCLTCRRRHVRCDERRPQWLEQSPHKKELFLIPIQSKLHPERFNMRLLRVLGTAHVNES